MSQPVLDSDIACRRGDFRLAVGLAAHAGRLTALVGPNGSGKSTVLRAIAGLLPLGSGHVSVDDVALSAPGRGIHVVTERRPIGLVFQDHLLFPTMTARDNIAFGLRARGIAKREARATAAAALESMGLAHRGGARPVELSGGEAQRVALARALAVKPRLLLLDEPFAALDADARAGLRTALRQHVATFDGATILVSHDPLDVLVLADDVVVIEQGHVVQTGSPNALASRPRTDYVARLAGLNLLRGLARGTHAVVGSATVALDAAYDGEVLIAIRPTSVAVHHAQPEGSPRNVWPAVISTVELHGDQVRIATTGAFELRADVTTGAAAELRLEPGLAVWLSVKATEVTAYPA